MSGTQSENGKIAILKPRPTRSKRRPDGHERIVRASCVTRIQNVVPVAANRNPMPRSITAEETLPKRNILIAPSGLSLRLLLERGQNVERQATASSNATNRVRNSRAEHSAIPPTVGEQAGGPAISPERSATPRFAAYGYIPTTAEQRGGEEDALA